MELCPCWSLKSGCYGIAWWTAASGLVWMGLFAWQIVAISNCGDHIITTSSLVDACYNMPNNCPCEADMDMYKLGQILNALYIIQVINVVFEALLFFASLSLLYGILAINEQFQGSKFWFWLYFPSVIGCIVATSGYCITWWASGVVSGYWIFLTVLAAVCKLINIYGFLCVCALYKRIKPIPKYYYEMVSHKEPESDTLTYRTPESSRRSEIRQNGQPLVYMYRHDGTAPERKMMSAAPAAEQGFPSDDSGIQSTPPKKPVPIPRNKPPGYIQEYEAEPFSKKTFPNDQFNGEPQRYSQQAPELPIKQQPVFVDPTVSPTGRTHPSGLQEPPFYAYPSPRQEQKVLLAGDLSRPATRNHPTYQVPVKQPDTNQRAQTPNQQPPNVEPGALNMSSGTNSTNMSDPAGCANGALVNRNDSKPDRNQRDHHRASDRRRRSAAGSSDSDYDDVHHSRGRSNDREEKKRYVKRGSSRDRNRHSDREAESSIQKSPHQRRMENRHRRSGHFDSDREGSCRGSRRRSQSNERSMKNSRSEPNLKDGRANRSRRDSGHAVAENSKQGSSIPDIRSSGAPFSYTHGHTPSGPATAPPKRVLVPPNQQGIKIESEYTINMTRSGSTRAN